MGENLLKKFDEETVRKVCRELIESQYEKDFKESYNIRFRLESKKKVGLCSLCNFGLVWETCDGECHQRCDFKDDNIEVEEFKKNNIIVSKCSRFLDIRNTELDSEDIEAQIDFIMDCMKDNNSEKK